MVSGLSSPAAHAHCEAHHSPIHCMITCFFIVVQCQLYVQGCWSRAYRYATLHVYMVTLTLLSCIPEVHLVFNDILSICR